MVYHPGIFRPEFAVATFLFGRGVVDYAAASCQSAQLENQPENVIQFGSPNSQTSPLHANLGPFLRA